MRWRQGGDGGGMDYRTHNFYFADPPPPPRPPSPTPPPLPSFFLPLHSSPLPPLSLFPHTPTLPSLFRASHGGCERHDADVQGVGGGCGLAEAITELSCSHQRCVVSPKRHRWCAADSRAALQRAERKGGRHLPLLYVN